MISNLPQREEFLRKKRNRRIFKYLIVLISITALLGLLSYISYRPSLRISKVELSGGILVTEKDVEAKTLEYLDGSYFWIFPKDNVIWIPKNSLKRHLADNFKRIDNTEVSLKNLNTLSVKITERKPIATWCSGSFEEETSNISKCWFIDQNSTVFAPAPFFSGDAYFKYYGLIVSDSPIGLEYMASTTKFSEMVGFVESIKKLSLYPQYITAKNENEFSLVISGDGEIYFDIKKPLPLVLENLETLLLNSSLMKDLSNLDYIDLRYGNKLFYKLRD